jgi:hypothetical protein
MLTLKPFDGRFIGSFPVRSLPILLIFGFSKIGLILENIAHCFLRELTSGLAPITFPVEQPGNFVVTVTLGVK